MEENYFGCNPEKFKCGVRCCSTRDTSPDLTFGDFLRLSEHTGEDIVSIWRTKGTVLGQMLSEDSLLILSTGIIHNPECAYLSDSKCRIYEARPLSCRRFPLDHSSEWRKKRFANYPCVAGAFVSDEQMLYETRLKRILDRESEIDLGALWDGRTRKFDFHPFNTEPYKLLELALREADKPHFRRDSPEWLNKFVDSLSLKYAGKNADRSGELLLGEIPDLIFSILFVLQRENLANRLQKAKRHAKKYRETTKKLMELNNS